MRRSLLVVLILVVAAGLFFAGYFMGLPPSEAEPCVDALRELDSDFADQCRDALDRIG